MKLTRLALRGLKPGQHATAGGIRFDRLKNGDGRFTVEIMVDRVRVHRVIGLESEGVTLTQAEQFIEQARADARRDRLSLPKGRKVALEFFRGGGVPGADGDQRRAEPQAETPAPHPAPHTLLRRQADFKNRGL